MPSNKQTLPPIAGTVVTGTAAEAYKFAEKFNPRWYDRDSGWKGQTYDAAFEFCSQKGPNHDVCPYEIICPGGPLSMPYGGAKNEQAGSWAPVSLLTFLERSLVVSNILLIISFSLLFFQDEYSIQFMG